MSIIFDIDGVLADCSHRLRFIQGEEKDWDSFHSDEELEKDSPMPRGFDLFKKISASFDYTLDRNRDFVEIHQVIFITGRPNRNREATKKWFFNSFGFSINDFLLFMRDDKDHRKAVHYKKSVIQQLPLMGINPTLAVDDDIEICKMYVKSGIPALCFMSEASSLWEPA